MTGPGQGDGKELLETLEQNTNNKTDITACKLLLDSVI